jgi:hypothetical protein
MFKNILFLFKNGCVQKNNTGEIKNFPGGTLFSFYDSNNEILYMGRTNSAQILVLSFNNDNKSIHLSQRILLEGHPINSVCMSPFKNLNEEKNEILRLLDLKSIKLY